MKHIIKCIPNFKNNKMRLPVYAKANDACVDLQANIREKTYVMPEQSIIINTGLRIELPSTITEDYDWELQIRPRSGLAAKSGITVLNSPGTIDAGYRDEIGVILYNHSNNVFWIYPGDRIAQAKLSKSYRQEWVQISELSNTDRNMGGFGHTGS
jgi:dUTP pyrophosphatase